jgi:LacI family transcriptional regulator
MVRPGLTTVDVPKYRMAALAMQVLMMEQKFEDRQNASIILPTQLIVRESCGAKQNTSD